MNLWSSLSGVYHIKVTSADINKALSTIRRAGISLEEITVVDDLSLCFYVLRKDFRRLKEMMERRGEELEILKKKGLYWKFSAMTKRPVLLCGIVFLILMTLFLPTRIYFLRVEGNSQIPTNQILEIVTRCGITFGCSRQEVRSEQMKNALLEALPQLEWAGVNTAGCVATISVRERQNTDAPPQPEGVTRIVAVRDGIIQELTVTSGNPLCKVGQAVKAGQTLVSGYTDCGLSIRAERAKGEIYATTMHQFSALYPLDWSSRGERSDKITKFSLIIGKKRINFYQGSGILGADCVKMYEENYLTLPGGFVLPIALVREHWITYELSSDVGSTDALSHSLCVEAEKYLRGQMVAGQILSKQEEISQEEDVLLLDANYECIEMIGREQSEEIIK
ncbi:MAG: hypothetical protein E7454_04940 [Ruminococcaceae bacterium]|nr:hypothetical protein [Oscillospiraceae bacterium]